MGGPKALGNHTLLEYRLGDRTLSYWVFLGESTGGGMAVCGTCGVTLIPSNQMGSEKVLNDIDICRKCAGYPEFREQGIAAPGQRFNWDPEQALAKKKALPAEGRQEVK